MLIAAASCSGFAGGIAGNFADVLNVRMQNDAVLPVHARRNYKHVFDGLVRMTREEGVGSWFRGWLANSSRAAAQTAGQLASYDTIKRQMMRVLDVEDTMGLQASASFLAGAIAATVTNPIDVVKTRVMSSSASQGIADVVRKMWREDGARWVFKGWVPSFLRIGP
jgi:dicarboxylate transporter 10